MSIYLDDLYARTPAWRVRRAKPARSAHHRSTTRNRRGSRRVPVTAYGNFDKKQTPGVRRGRRRKRAWYEVDKFFVAVHCSKQDQPLINANSGQWAVGRKWAVSSGQQDRYAIHPLPTVRSFCVSEGEDLSDASGSSLVDARGQHLDRIFCFWINLGKHHDRFQAQVEPDVGVRQLDGLRIGIEQKLFVSDLLLHSFGAPSVRS